MTTHQRIALILMTLLLHPLMLLAQQPSTFLIRRIEVRGARFTPAGVVARESLLQEGRSYTEAELQDALARVKRLPFVLNASASLEKDADGGAYVYAISIVEAKPLFVDAQSATTDFEDFAPRRHTEETVVSGGQWFLGSASQIHASTDFDENYQAGISQYNLFGHPGFVTLNVRWTSSDGTIDYVDPVGNRFASTVEIDPSPELRFGVPIAGNHSVEGGWDHQSSKWRMESGTLFNERAQDADTADLSWVFNTTDDELLPTRGTLWRAGVHSYRVSQDEQTNADSQILRGSSRSESAGFNYARFVPLNGLMSVMFGGGGGTGRDEFNYDLDGDDRSSSSRMVSLYPQAGFSTSLWPERLTRRLGDLRWETRTAYVFSRSEGFDSRYFNATTAIVQRSVWGTLRLAYSYNNSEFD